MSFNSWYSRYGIRGLISLFINKLYTLFFYNSARLIRRPFYLRGWKWISLGKNLTTGVGCRIEAIPLSEKDSKDKIIILGNNIQINDYVHIAGVNNVIIKDNVLIASKVFITDHDHGIYAEDSIHSNPDEIPEDRIINNKPVIINENVWIGESVSILSGVVIGKGSIIGANSVVNKDIPPYSIAVGTPARVVKEYNFEEQKWITIKK